MLEGKPQTPADEKVENGIEAHARHMHGHDNSVFSNDEPPAYPNGKSTALPNHLQMYNSNTQKPHIQESSRL